MEFMLFSAFTYGVVAIYALTWQPANILMNPTAMSREEVGDFFMPYFVRPVVLLFLLSFAVCYLVREKISKPILAGLAVITLFLGSIEVSSVLNGSQGYISYYMLYSKLSCCFIGMIVFAIGYRSRIVDSTNILVFIVSTVVIALFWSIAHSMGFFILNLRFDNLGLVIDRLGSPLIVSTEFSNICFLVFLLGILLLLDKKGWQRPHISVLLIIGCGFTAYLTTIMFSTGTYLAGLAILFLWFYRANRRKRFVWVLIGSGIVSLGFIFSDFMHEYFLFKADDPGRLVIYKYLVNSVVNCSVDE